MSTVTPTLLRMTELESAGRLLRFCEPLEAELEVFPGEGASIWSETLELGTTGQSEEETREMFADLIISVYEEYRSIEPGKLSEGAMRQKELLESMVSGIYVRK